MAEVKKIQHKLIGFTPYKSGKGKALFVQRYGCDGVVGVACDTVFLSGKNHEKITEDSIGHEIDLKRGYNKEKEEYYVYDVDIK